MSPAEMPLGRAMIQSTWSNANAAAKANVCTYARRGEQLLQVEIGTNMAYLVGFRVLYLLKAARVPSHWSEIARAEVTHIDNLPKLLKYAGRHGWKVTVFDPRDGS